MDTMMMMMCRYLGQRESQHLPAAGQAIASLLKVQPHSAEALNQPSCSSTCSSPQAHCYATSSIPPAVDWDWKWVVGAKQGRKPAIKRPARHQWHYCNPYYDPNRPLPAQMLPPHAPPSAHEVDDWAVHDSLALPGADPVKHRRAFVRFRRLRDVDWREAFQRGLAGHIKQLKKAQRIQDEATRQQSWWAYKERVFKASIGDREQVKAGVQRE